MNLKVKESEVAQSCPTLCNPMDCSLSVSSVLGIFQARVLEWIAFSFSRGSSQPRNRTWVSCIAGGRFTIWATREALNKQWQVQKTFAPWKKSYDKPRQHIKKQSHHFADKGPYSRKPCFSSSHVWMWELDHKEGWAPKNWCFWIVVLEKILESPLDSKEIQPVNPKGNQHWIFVGRNNAEAVTPILWQTNTKSWLIGKDTDAGKDWRQKEGSRG